MGGDKRRSFTGFCSKGFPLKIKNGPTYCYDTEEEKNAAKAKAEAEQNAAVAGKFLFPNSDITRKVDDDSSERPSTGRRHDSLTSMREDEALATQPDPSLWKSLFVDPKLQEIPDLNSPATLKQEFENCIITDKNNVIYSIPDTINKSESKDIQSELAGKQFFTILFNQHDRPTISTISIKRKGDGLESRGYLPTTYKYDQNNKIALIGTHTIFPEIMLNPLQVANALRIHDTQTLEPEKYMYLATKFTNYYSKCTCDGTEIKVNSTYALENKTIEIKEIFQTFELINGQIFRKVYVNYTECIDKRKETDRESKKTNQTIRNDLRGAFYAYFHDEKRSPEKRSTYFKVLTETPYKLTADDIAKFNQIMQDESIRSEEAQRLAPLPVNILLPNKGLQKNGIYMLSNVCEDGTPKANCNKTFYMTVVEIKPDGNIEYSLNSIDAPHRNMILRQNHSNFHGNIENMSVSRCKKIPEFEMNNEIIEDMNIDDIPSPSEQQEKEFLPNGSFVNNSDKEGELKGFVNQAKIAQDGTKGGRKTQRRLRNKRRHSSKKR